MAEKTVQKAFSCTGIWPLDPSVILGQVEEQEKELRPSSRDSVKSKIEANDWSTVRAYWKSCVKDTRDRKTRKIFDWMIAQSTRATLAEIRAQGLEKSLKNLSKRKQVNRPLTQAIQNEQPGQCIIWSPHKLNRALEVQKARDDELELKKKAKETKKQEKAAAKISASKGKYGLRNREESPEFVAASDDINVPKSPSKSSGKYQRRGAEIARKLAQIRRETSATTPTKKGAKNQNLKVQLDLQRWGCPQLG